MSEKEKLSNEISNLTNAEVKMLRRFLKSIKATKPSYKKEDLSAYLEVRKALKGIKGSLSDDIVTERDERV